MENDISKESKSNDFADKKPKSKTPWLMLGVVIVTIALGIQFGINLLRDKTEKKGGLIEESHYAPEIKKDTLSAPALVAIDDEKEALKKKVAVLADALKKQNELLKKSSSLSAKLKQGFNQNKDMDKILSSKASIPLGASDTSNKEGQGQELDEQQLIEKLSKAREENTNSAFMKQVSSSKFETEDAIQIENLELKILEGKAIKGVLDSAIDSDLPGLIKAHVTEDVYGEEGTTVLIPNGSQLIGKYRSGFFPNGAVRVFIVWTRVKIPGGISIKLNSAGSDQIGRAGMTGSVDAHYIERFGGSLLMSMLSFGVSTAGVSNQDQYNSKSAVRMGLAQSLSNTASNELQQSASIQPTIRIHQGQKLTIIVNKDLNFEHVARELAQ